MNVRRFLPVAREKEKSIRATSQDRRTHGRRFCQFFVFPTTMDALRLTKRVSSALPR
jgi:hypothetical protein